DASNPDLTGTPYDLALAGTYSLGDPKSTDNFNNKTSNDKANIDFKMSPHIVPISVRPSVSGLLYREEYTRDELLDHSANPLTANATKVFPEVWMYGSDSLPNFDLTGATPNAD